MPGSGDDDADARAIAADRRERSAVSPDRAATGSADGYIDRHAAASSIQTGTSWRRITGAPTRLQRAAAPVVLSITSWTQTDRPAHGCQA